MSSLILTALLWHLRLRRGYSCISSAGFVPIVYTDFSEYALKLRPEIGLGLYNCGLTYDYNMGVINNDFEGVNKHVFFFKYYVAKKRNTLNEYDQSGK